MQRIPLSATICGLLLVSSSAFAQDAQAPPTVQDDAGGPVQENKTEAADDLEESSRVDGWSPGLALGVGFNLVDTRSVVGQQDGTTLTLSGGLDTALEFNAGIHEWRNSLIASAGVARTPSVDEFIKTNDGLAFESIYLLHAMEMFGPFARFGLNTQMFSATDVRPAAVDYSLARLDGTTQELTGRRLALTDPFQPLTLKESLGVFVQPLREDYMELEARAGLGAQETFAKGGFGVTDDDATETIEVTELDDTFVVGSEAVVNAWGFFDPGKRISYTVGLGVLFPFVTSELAADDDRSLIELTTIETRAGLNVKLFDWASVTYKLAAVKQPLLIDDWQISNSLLLTIGAAFGSKAPVPEEPPPPCECEDALPPLDATDADGVAVPSADVETELDAPAPAPEPEAPAPAPPAPEPAPPAPEPAAPDAPAPAPTP
jgi:hypothetical protein